jgi:DNA-binding transcriptional LysR family regulator
MNYTQAAGELGLTQPAVSKHIRSLEDFYQVKLFSYSNRKLYLTKQGIYLKNVMNAMNHDSMRIREDIVNLNRKNRIKIGATLSIGNYYLPDRLISFLKNNENIDISITIADTKELLNKLDSGELSFILCEGNFNKSDYDYQLIKNSHLVAFCGKDYDYSSIHGVKDLFSHRILLREKGSGTRDIIEHFLAEKGYSIQSFDSYYEVNSTELILKMLVADMGISILYQDVGSRLVIEGQLKEIPLSDLSLQHEFNAVWAKGSIHCGEYAEMVGKLQLLSDYQNKY